MNEFPHYWICGKCAEARGGKWPEGHVATVVVKRCEYCNDKNRSPNEAIAPWVDYDWPDLDTRMLRD